MPVRRNVIADCPPGSRSTGMSRPNRSGHRLNKDWRRFPRTFYPSRIEISDTDFWGFPRDNMTQLCTKAHGFSMEEGLTWRENVFLGTFLMMRRALSNG